MNKNITALGFVMTIVAVGIAATTASDADAAAANTRRAVTYGSFELSLDGLTPTFVSTIDGGVMMAEVVAEPANRGTFAKKKAGPAKFEPFVFTTPPNKAWADWINSSLDGKEKARNGSLSMLDLNYKELNRRTFTNLRLAEVAVPELDAASSKKQFELKMTLLGDTATEVKGSGAQATSQQSSASKRGPTTFKVTIPGLQTSQVSRVSEIVTKSAGVPLAVAKGELSRFASGATRSDVASFSVFMVDNGADTTWKTWFQSFVVNQKNSDADEKTMTIELMTTTGAVAFRVKLEGVGIVGLAPTQLEARADAQRLLEAELYAESIRFEDATGGK